MGRPTLACPGGHGGRVRGSAEPQDRDRYPSLLARKQHLCVMLCTGAVAAESGQRRQSCCVPVLIGIKSSPRHHHNA